MKTTAPLPALIYGTAWKENQTADLVKKAIAAGFRAIDTANQKKHYREDYVGEALLAVAEQGISRSSLFLQSKFTYIQGQDHRLPYNPSDEVAKQVRDSFASTLKHLHTDYLDSYLLHGPSSWGSLEDSDWEVWNTLEELYETGQTKAIGVSNFGIQQLHELTQRSKIKPIYVQNRCFANRGWDQAVREYCLAHSIVYQGFSLLTANPHVLNDPRLKVIANRLNAAPQQVIFCFAKQIGILPLTGTTNETHMKDDLNAPGLELTKQDIGEIFEIG